MLSASGLTLASHVKRFSTDLIALSAEACYIRISQPNNQGEQKMKEELLKIELDTMYSTEEEALGNGFIEEAKKQGIDVSFREAPELDPFNGAGVITLVGKKGKPFRDFVMGHWFDNGSGDSLKYQISCYEDRPETYANLKKLFGLR